MGILNATTMKCMEPVVEPFDGAAGGGGHAWGTNLDDAKSTVCFLRSVAAYHHAVALLHADGVSQRVFLSKQWLEVIANEGLENARCLFVKRQNFLTKKKKTRAR